MQQLNGLRTLRPYSCSRVHQFALHFLHLVNVIVVPSRVFGQNQQDKPNGENLILLILSETIAYSNFASAA
jgi:hypothetical protein